MPTDCHCVGAPYYHSEQCGYYPGYNQSPKED